jgi:hypothetical protein
MMHIGRQVGAIAAELTAELRNLAADMIRDVRELAAELAGKGNL